MLAKQEVIVFGVQLKYVQSGVFYLVRIKIEKQVYIVRQKMKTYYLKALFG